MMKRFAITLAALLLLTTLVTTVLYLDPVSPVDRRNGTASPAPIVIPHESSPDWAMIVESIIESFREALLWVMDLFTSNAVAADRYLVLGDAGCTVTAIATDAGCWSAASGGAGGAGVPVSGDDAFLDAASGVGTGTFNAAINVGGTGRWDMTGFVGTITTANFALTIGSDGFVIRGTFNAGSSVITLNGDWNSSGGTFSSGTSTVIFASSASVTKTSDETLYNLTVSSGVTLSNLVTDEIIVTRVLTVNGTVDMGGANRFFRITNVAGVTDPLVMGASGAIVGVDGTSSGGLHFRTEAGALINIPGKVYTGMRLLLNPQNSVGGDGVEYRLTAAATFNAVEYTSSGAGFPAFFNSQSFNVIVNGGRTQNDIYLGESTRTTAVGIKSTTGTWTISGGVNFVDELSYWQAGTTIINVGKDWGGPGTAAGLTGTSMVVFTSSGDIFSSSTFYNMSVSESTSRTVGTGNLAHTVNNTMTVNGTLDLTGNTAFRLIHLANTVSTSNPLVVGPSGVIRSSETEGGGPSDSVIDFANPSSGANNPAIVNIPGGTYYNFAFELVGKAVGTTYVATGNWATSANPLTGRMDKGVYVWLNAANPLTLDLNSRTINSAGIQSNVAGAVHGIVATTATVNLISSPTGYNNQALGGGGNGYGTCDCPMPAGFYINFGSSTWNVEGDWSSVSTSTSWNAGTGTVNFIGMGDGSVQNLGDAGGTKNLFNAITMSGENKQIRIDDFTFVSWTMTGATAMNMDGISVVGASMSISSGNITLTAWVSHTSITTRWTFNPNTAGATVTISLTRAPGTYLLQRDNVEIQRATSTGMVTFAVTGGWSSHDMAIVLFAPVCALDAFVPGFSNIVIVTIIAVLLVAVVGAVLAIKGESLSGSGGPASIAVTIVGVIIVVVIFTVVFAGFNSGC